MLSALWERLRFPDRTTAVLTGEDRAGIPPELLAARHLTELRLEEGLPVWRYEAGGAVVEKRLVMPYGQNTVHVTYRLLDGPPTVRLTLRPSMHVRAHNAPSTSRSPSRTRSSPSTDASRSCRAAACRCCG
jgi:hypothetical protein